MAGRKSGYTHSEETKQKIKKARLGQEHAPETKNKIALAMLGNSNASASKKHCELRFQELKSFYPEFSVFFESNKQDLISMFEDVRSERELDLISLYRESEDIQKYRNKVLFNYPSSSTDSQEDLVVNLVDYYHFIKTY